MPDSVCQAYGWSLEEAMRLTLPQMIMLNHAAWVNQERSKRRFEYEREKEKLAASKPKKASELVIGNKTMDKMSSEEMVSHFMKWE